jgi:hypothetical protein
MTVRVIPRPPRRVALVLALAGALGLSVLAGASLVLVGTPSTAVGGALVAALVAFGLYRMLAPGATEAERRIALRGLAVALMVRVVAAVTFHLVLVATDWRQYGGLFFDDEPYYDATGWAIAQSWRDGAFAAPDQVLYPFQYFVGAIYALFGHEPLAVRLCNAGIGAVLAPLAFHLCRMVLPESPRSAQVAMWIIALSPDQILWSVALMRDIQLALGSLVLALTVAAFSVSRVRLARGMLLTGLVLTFNFAMRRVLGWLQLLALACHWVVWLVQGTRGRALGSRLAAVSGMCLVAIGADVVGSRFGVGVLDVVGAIEFVQQEYFGNQRYLDRYYGSESQYALNQIRGGPTEVIPLAATLVRGTFQPSPWWLITVPNLNSTLMFLPAVSWYVLIPFWVVGAVVVPRASRHGVLVVVLALLVFVAGTAGLGVALEPVRARVPVLPLLHVLAAHALVQWSTGRLSAPSRLWLLAYAVAVAMGSLHYLVWWAQGSLEGIALAGVLGLSAATLLHWVLGRRRAWAADSVT